MKKLLITLAAVAAAWSTQAKVIFFETATKPSSTPKAHIWTDGGQSDYSWNVDDSKMKTTGDDCLFYITTKPERNRVIFHLNGSKDWGEDVTYNAGDAALFFKGVQGSATQATSKIEAHGNWAATNSWSGLVFTYAGNNKFTTEPRAFDRDDYQMVLKMTIGTTERYLKGSGTAVDPSKSSVTLNGNANQALKLHGTYSLVLDFSGAAPVLTAQATQVTPPVAQLSVTPSLASGTEFYNNVKALTLTPSAGVSTWTVKVNSQGTRRYTGTAPQTIELGEGDNYGTDYQVVVTLSDAEGNQTTATLTYSKKFNVTDWATGDKYYFYGDMNAWTVIGVEHRDTGGDFYYQDPNTGQGKMIEDVYRDADKMAADNPHRKDRYASVEDMIDLWRFKPATTLPAGLSGDGWLMLDMRNTVPNDGSHTDGRLCGQFKIISGDWNTRFGGSQNNWDNSFVAPNTQVTVGTQQHNLHLQASVYENAVIYFHPTNNKIYIQATPRDLYVYYWNKATDVRPGELKLLEGEQYNYATGPTDGFTPENMEQVPHGTPVTSGGVTYTSTAGQGHIYRIKLPLSSEHRNPIAFSATIKGADGQTVVEREVRCDDIWLIEGAAATLAVDLRGCSDLDCGPLYYNLQRPIFTQGQITGWESLYTEPRYMTRGDDGLWTGATRIPSAWQSGTQAIITTAFGREIALDYNGQDVITVTDDQCGNDAELSLLYSHAKGSYTTACSDLQIQAELFTDAEHTALNTSYSEVEYTFSVYNAMGTLLQTQTDTKPYMDYTPAVAGWLNITASATDAHGNTYTATDRFPVIDATAPVAMDAPVKTAQSEYVYFDNTDNWSKVYCYMWVDNNTNNAGWPGVQVTDKVSGTNIYKYKVPTGKSWKNLIFNNNSGSQTADYNFTAGNKYKPGQNQSWAGEAYTDPSEAGLTAPAKLHMHYSNGSWNLSGPEMTKEGDTFTLTGFELTGNDNYVTFAEGSGDWTAINNNRYGPSAADKQPTLGTAETIVKTNNNCFKVGQGKYNITVTFGTTPAATFTKYTDPEPPTPPVGEAFTIYFDNTASAWATPHVHYWGATKTTWPGVAMTQVKDNIWSYEVPAGTTGLVFNNGNKEEIQQSGDFAAMKGHIYTCEGGSQGEYHEDIYEVEEPYNPEANPFKPQALPAAHPEYSMPVLTNQGQQQFNWMATDYTSNATLEVKGGSGTAAQHHTNTYSWVKFENFTHTFADSRGTVTLDDQVTDHNGNPVYGSTGAPATYGSAPDNEMTQANHSTKHYCTNWFPAYYRVYMHSEVSNDPAVYAAKTYTAGMGTVTNYDAATRVARTVPAPSANSNNAETGVSMPGADDTLQEPVHYYNLQGQPVAAPVPGQIYLMRQGQRTAKVLVK